MGRPKIPGAVVTAICPVCGKEYTYNRSWPVKTCSRTCYLKTLPPKLTTTCPTCGKEFAYHQSWPRKYCSNACKGKANIGNIARFVPSRFTTTCEVCGKDYETTPKRTRGRVCSRECFADWMRENAATGEQSANWRGGYEPYYGASWPKARRAARERDKVCVDCGLSPETQGRALDVHHLVPFRVYSLSRHEEANRLDNLVSLCQPCHTRREWGDNRP